MNIKIQNKKSKQLQKKIKFNGSSTYDIKRYVTLKPHSVSRTYKIFSKTKVVLFTSFKILNWVPINLFLSKS